MLFRAFGPGAERSRDLNRFGYAFQRLDVSFAGRISVGRFFRTDGILVDFGRNGHVSTRGAPVGEIVSVDVAVLVVRCDFGFRQSDGSASSRGASTRAC